MDILQKELDELKAIEGINMTKEQKIRLYQLIELLREPKVVEPCKCENLKVEFMGGGFLRTCKDCGEIVI